MADNNPIADNGWGGYTVVNQDAVNHTFDCFDFVQD